MESDRFDRLVQRAQEAASRRGVVRAGIGALAASAFITLRLTQEAEGRRQKKKGRKRRLICFQGETLVVRRRKRFLKQGATKGACPDAVCPADKPITCGNGCCPTNFSQCCDGEQGTTPVGSKICAPSSATCCPANLGGSACLADAPQCCPPTEQDPLGTCAPMGATCCTTETGGGFCSAETPVCCPPPDTISGADAAVCCHEDETCCNTNEDCPSDRVCLVGCCVEKVPVRSASRGRGHVARGRFRMASS